MKESGTSHWRIEEFTDATNSSGFTGLPGGYRDNIDGHFGHMNAYGFWWSSSEFNTGNAWSRNLCYVFDNAFRNNDGKQNGYSVRCIKDWQFEIFFARNFSNFFWDKINFELTQSIVNRVYLLFCKYVSRSGCVAMSSRYKNSKSLRVEFVFLQIRIEKLLSCLSSRYKNLKRQNFLLEQTIHSHFE
jgi:Fibrobacter succinogenes major domain (Fib_succ_major)